MAKVVITFEDNGPDDGIRIVCDPSAESLRNRVQRGGSAAVSPAEGIAIICLTHILTHGKTPRGRIINPFEQ